MYKEPGQFLDSDPATSRVMTHARLLLKLSRRFEAIAPAGLRYSAHVANFKSGKIVIHANNGAVASKIRQLSDRLCRELSQGGAECTGMEVKVQPLQIPCQSTSSTPKPLSAKTFGVLKNMAESLPAGPLRTALDTLMNSAARQE